MSHSVNPADIKAIDPLEDGFYSRVILADGIPIKAHADVSDEAMLEAARRISRLLQNIPVVRDNLIARGAEHHIIAVNQQCSDLPEWRHMKGESVTDRTGTGKMLFDDRVRGMGGIISSSGEDNLLQLPDERYTDHRDICTHEFAHGIQMGGMSENVVRAFEEQHGRARGLWPSYAGTNEHEYFAELTMWYFGTRGDYGAIDPEPEPGAEWLKQHDPAGYALIDDFYAGRLPVQRIVET
ncbi:MAG TPA: hypothetical protein VGM51_18015 [Armatimonadota bacterium]|jgi:hypothetical protein